MTTGAWSDIYSRFSYCDLTVHPRMSQNALERWLLLKVSTILGVIFVYRLSMGRIYNVIYIYILSWFSLNFRTFLLFLIIQSLNLPLRSALSLSLNVKSVTYKHRLMTCADKREGGTAISLFNTRRVMICTQRGLWWGPDISACVL